MPPAPPQPANPPTNSIARQETYVAMALDPIHIGTGEFRLGRVDNTIVREPGTNLPKIPGSSIAGVARAYAAMKTGKYLKCAGKGGKDGEVHCGNCEVCHAFGFSKPSIGSFQGLAQFSDARLLFFPVYSLIGPVWISCPSALENAGISQLGNSTWQEWKTTLGEKALIAFSGISLAQINLGWLYLETYPSITVPANWPDTPANISTYLASILARLVIVSDALFSTIVDDQLEVRTSVSISPETGAAEPGALFTSEALPRSSVLVFQVTALNPANFRVPNPANGQAHSSAISDIHETVFKGLDLIELLGIGGINTRGMGRLKIYESVNSTNV